MILDLIHKLIEFILSFNAYTYFIENRKIVLYLLVLVFSLYSSTDYMGVLYSLKKSSKAMKIIRKQYPLIQQILLVHMYQNLYKKIDRFWFDISYVIYLINLGLLILVNLLFLLSFFFSCFNIITGIAYAFHFAWMIMTIIIFFLQTKVSPSGGVEQRCAKKYSKKNW